MQDWVIWRGGGAPPRDKLWLLSRPLGGFNDCLLQSLIGRLFPFYLSRISIIKMARLPGVDVALKSVKKISGKEASRLPAFNKVHCLDALPLLKEIRGANIFDVVIADPPYNIGKTFGDYEDNLSLHDYIGWSLQWINECLRLIKESAPIYIYGYPEILAHISIHQPLENQRWLVWHYTNKTVPSSRFWQRSHESILCLWKGKKPAINVDAVREEYTPAFINGAAGKVRKETYCRYSSKGRKTIYQAHPNGALPRDVIKVPALAGGAGYSERWFYCKNCKRLCDPKENALHSSQRVIKHPTQKPLALCQKLLQSAIANDGKALIPFAGSGAECVTAQQLGIDFLAAELSKDYALLANAWIKHVIKRKR